MGQVKEGAKVVFNGVSDAQVDHQLDHLDHEFDDTERHIKTKRWICKPSAFIVLMCIPILSAVISALATEKVGGWALKGPSYVLTLVTLLNSVFKPADRFRELCRMSMSVHSLRDAFISELRKKWKDPDKETAAIQLCEEYEKKLNPMNTRLIELYLPYSPDQKQGANKNP